MFYKVSCGRVRILGAVRFAYLVLKTEGVTI